jgi:signal peptidase II
MGLFAYIVVYARNIRTSRVMAFALIFAGGMGNILDRLLFNRHVTDFMNVGIQSLRSGIFNFADLWITIGVAWLALASFKKPSLEFKK